MHADPAHLITAGYLDRIDRDLSDLSVRGVECIAHIAQLLTKKY